MPCCRWHRTTLGRTQTAAGAPRACAVPARCAPHGTVRDPSRVEGPPNPL